MVAKQKSFEDESESDEVKRPGSVAALRNRTTSIPGSIRQYLAAGVEAEEIEELLAFLPGSIQSLSGWIERYADRPEVTSVEFRIDRSSTSPVVVPTAYTTVSNDEYIPYLMDETKWWLDTYRYPLDIIRPAIW